jgi:hypothetical protein
LIARSGNSGRFEHRRAFTVSSSQCFKIGFMRQAVRPFQRSLARESAVVGVRVNFSTQVRMPSGCVVWPAAHFPDFGAPRGTLVFHSFDEYRDLRKELAAEGYACSEFGHSSDHNFEPNSLRETLADWGWSNVHAPAPSTHPRRRGLSTSNLSLKTSSGSLCAVSDVLMSPSGGSPSRSGTAEIRHFRTFA